MNVADHVSLVARAAPQRAAIRFEGKTLSYGVLDACADALAASLKRAGIARGDRVALYLPNIPAFALAYLAVLRAGAIAVSVNAIFKSEEVKYILNDSGARLVFTTADLLTNLPRAECPGVRATVLCEGRVAGESALEDWLAAAEPGFAAAHMDNNDTAALLYSSGTTGFPKGVELTHGNIASNIRTVVKHCGFRADDRLAVFLPLFHVFAQNFIMNGGFEAGATLVLFRRFSPDAVVPALDAEKISMFFAVPTIFIALLGSGIDKRGLASVRFFFSAAASMPQEISRRWSALCGQPVYEGYGLTECSPFAAYNHSSRHKFGSVGTAVQDFELRIVDEEDRELPRGEWGEIAIRGPGVMKAYWGKPADTRRALRNGWLHSGDIGRMDDEGYVFIVDRVKDMINISGFKVWPAEIEHYLYQIADIREVAVYGVSDSIKGESVRVAVVLRENSNMTAEAIIAWCKDKLAAYKTPQRVDIVAALPKSATGKILKRILREQAAGTQV